MLRNSSPVIVEPPSSTIQTSRASISRICFHLVIIILQHDITLYYTWYMQIDTFHHKIKVSLNFHRNIVDFSIADTSWEENGIWVYLGSFESVKLHNCITQLSTQMVLLIINYIIFIQSVHVSQQTREHLILNPWIAQRMCTYACPWFSTCNTFTQYSILNSSQPHKSTLRIKKNINWPLHSGASLS